MLCKCHWIVLYTVHFTAFCLGGRFFPGHGVAYIVQAGSFRKMSFMITTTGWHLSHKAVRGTPFPVPPLPPP